MDGTPGMSLVTLAQVELERWDRGQRKQDLAQVRHDTCLPVVSIVGMSGGAIFFTSFNILDEKYLEFGDGDCITHILNISENLQIL